MRVYIVRHGDAAAQADGERALTPQGVAEAEAVAELLAHEAPDLVLYSPKLRARETAMRIVDAIGDVSSKEAESLLPSSSESSAAQAIEAAGVDSLVLVSHLPLVADLVAWLSEGDSREFRLPGFPTAGMVVLDMDVVGRAMATVAWYAFPPNYYKRH